jgi:hypothetical protein
MIDMIAPGIPRRLDSPWAVALVVAVIYFVFLSTRIKGYDDDMSRFITAGDRYTDPRATPTPVYVQKDGDGYDGQFYFRLAFNPFATEQKYAGITFDNPPYRQQRILYPMIVWALSFRNKDIMPEAMIFVNYAAVCLIGWMAGRYAQIKNRHAILGMSIPLYPGFLLSLSRDTTEIVAICFVFCGLLLAAALTKETSIIFMLAYLPVSLSRLRRDKETDVISNGMYLAAFVIFLFWQFLLYQEWRSLPILSGSNNIGIPILGILEFLQNQLTFHSYLNIVWLIEFALLSTFTIATLVKTRNEISIELRVVFFLYLCLTLMLSSHVWVDDWAFLRATSELYVVGIVILIRVSKEASTKILYYMIPLWIYLCLNVLYGR